MLGFDGEYPDFQEKTKFWRFLVKICEKSAVKHSIEKPILLNFVNFSLIFCRRLHAVCKNKKDQGIKFTKELDE